MADGISIQVSGLKQVNKDLNSLSKQMRKRIVFGALRVGIKQIQKNARARVHSRSGRLRRGIVIKRSKINNGRRKPTLGLYLTIRTGKGRKDPKDAFYGQWVERGWNTKGPKRTSGGRGKGRQTQPGKTDVSGQHFMRRSLRSRRTVAVRATVKAVENGVRLVKQKLPSIS